MNKIKTLEIVAEGQMEITELNEREGRIERAQRNAYYEIGLELRAIREGEGYKVAREEQVAGRYSFTTFEEYCQERWEMKRERVHSLIQCAEATSKMSEISDVLPARESHVRALLAIKGENEDEVGKDRAEVWRRITSSGGNVSAKTIEAEVTKYQAEKEKDWHTLDEWKSMSEDERAEAMKRDGGKMFNSTNDNIEWARWSWNPVTGCKHGCDYCYARDIAARFYPQGFVPSFLPSRLSAPVNTKIPQEKESWSDVERLAYKTVFVCSMADLFGKWVPAEWIESVLERVWDNPEWNFLFLTKFPARMAEFEFPDNAWVGTTVDNQGAAKRAEKAFANITAGTKWLSCEPLMEDIKFGSLEMFDWVVMGGASSSSGHEGGSLIDKAPATEEFKPPFDWIANLYQQARDSGCKVYMKTNLLGDRVREYPEIG